MVDSTTAIQAASLPDTPAVQFAHATKLAASAKANQSNAANNAAFLTEVVQAELEGNFLASDSSQTNTQADAFTNDSSLNLDASSLSLLNEIGTDPTSANITGDLTIQQMQEIAVLQQDAIGLEEAAILDSNIPLSSGATTVDLSVVAQNIANGINSSTLAIINAVNAASPITTTQFTTTQLEQIAAIIAPLTNEPLTQSLLLQLQDQLTAIGISPLQISLQTVFIAMNYMGGLQSPQANVINAANIANIGVVESENEATVAPVASIDRVAIENSAILSE